ncbi:12857_t:CDS:2, partial [Ambispora leptoticha]
DRSGNSKRAQSHGLPSRSPAFEPLGSNVNKSTSPFMNIPLKIDFNLSQNCGCLKTWENAVFELHDILIDNLTQMCGENSPWIIELMYLFINKFQIFEKDRNIRKDILDKLNKDKTVKEKYKS